MQQEHTYAQDPHAVARYLLDEMNEEEREKFEDHFADCRVCGADVRDGARMMAAGRVVAREERPRTWLTWFPAVAASIFGILIGWQGAIRMAAPQLAAVELIDRQADLQTDQDRAEGDAPPQRFNAGEIVVLNFDIPSRDVAASYTVSVKGPSGIVGKPIPISRTRAEDPVSLELRALPGGSYQLVIEGVGSDGGRFPITSSPFEVVGES